MSRPFMGKDYLLDSETARALYHGYAAGLPIIDYHCHLEARDIFLDAPFEDLAQVWLGGDHYKWRALRSNGVSERFITGEAAPYEKFEQWARTLPKLIGNPLYAWTHLELRRYFGIDTPLDENSAPQIWETANEQLKRLSPRKLIRQSKVEALCTTDDPADDLHWHRLLAQEADAGFRVLPAFRPDRALNIEKPGYVDYLKKLGAAAGLEITDLDSLKEALRRRMDAFAECGCRTSDHGLDKLVFETGYSPNAVFEKALSGKPVSEAEADAFKTEALRFLAQAYRERGWAMQLHFGAARSNNPEALQALGPDTGFDAIRGQAETGLLLGKLLDYLGQGGGLPKTILYSLNPMDDPQIDTIIGCFQQDSLPGYIQHGSAWWFNDSKTGIEAQLTSLAGQSVLGNFIGMLTDSRSYLSYTRHEYFRRVLCNLLGAWAENGEYPRDVPRLGQMVRDICYSNIKRYLDL